MDAENLPFEVGEMIELKTFQKGFRSAWFRAKIISINTKKGKVGFCLNFVDYPDEKTEWNQIYQKCPYMIGNSKQTKSELMVRPAFPFFLCESEEPLEAPSNVLVAVHEMWKVGHLVDYLCDDCYWSATIVELLGENNFLVELIQPPMGEGGIFKVFFKDLRPSLDWTPKLGWTVPSTMSTEDFRPYVRFIQPCIEGSERNVCIHASCKNSLDMSAIMQHWSSGSGCTPPTINALNEEMLEVREQTIDTEPPQAVEVVQVDSRQSSANSPNPHLNSPELLRQSLDNKEPDSSCLPEVSLNSPHEAKHISCTEIVESSRRESDIPQKRNDDRYKDWSASAVKHSDPLESSIMDLEEFANKIAWLKGLFKFGIGSSNAMNSAWKVQSK